MGLGNVAWHATQTWSNPVLMSLEAQIPNPVFGTEPVEMGVNDSSVQEVLKRLASAKDVDYPARFQQAFPDAKGDPADLGEHLQGHQRLRAHDGHSRQPL